MSNYTYPKNKVIRNGKWADLYLFLIRKRIKLLAKLVGRILSCEIGLETKLPKRLFLAHPIGIVIGDETILGENVVINHLVTLGGKDPYFEGDSLKNEYPILKEGVYVGAGARILGHVTIGEWAIIGANAVITKDVPPHSVVVGHNKILYTKE